MIPEPGFNDLGTPDPSLFEATQPRNATTGLLISVPGVSEASALGRLLVRQTAGRAEIVLSAMRSSTASWGRWRVHGTSLDWFGPESGHAAAGDADILLDLHGSPRNLHCQQTWRVVDAFGRPVLHAFAGLDSPPDRPLVTSLYLIAAARGGWNTVAEIHLSTRRSYGDLLNALGRGIVWLVMVAIRNQSGSPASRRLPLFEPLSPTLREAVASRLQRVAANLRDHLGADVWAIGKITEPIDRLLTSRTVSANSWFEIPVHDGFVADPFPWPGRDGVILYERYANRTGVGSIEALVPDEDGRPRAIPLQLNISSHLSYPFTYTEAGIVLCLPEMLGERRQVIYRLKRDAPAAVLAVVGEDVAMADPTLFRHGGLYWIAYNDADLGLHENLCLRYATRLEGPWVPHPLNPVKMDVRSSRPGGAPFVVNGELFRPAQDCARSYGCALVINKVITCTPEQYLEEAIARLTPDPDGCYPDGFHTLSITADGILIDGKRIMFSGAITRQRIQRKLRAKWRRLFGTEQLPSSDSSPPRN